jgi:hypothetical protein
VGARALPQGTVTFLFTDLEGSTRLLEAHPAAYREAATRHQALLRTTRRATAAGLPAAPGPGWPRGPGTPAERRPAGAG